MRKEFLLLSISVIVVLAVGAYLWPPVGFAFGPALVLIGMGVFEMFQTKHAVRRNFPVIGRGRYLLEKIRPEINQYFVESNTDGMPFSREQRSVVYQRAKGELDTVPFGTQRDIYAVGYEWMEHSIMAKPMPPEAPRVSIGGATAREPYSAALLNVSAMSYGALSGHAIQALNLGARMGDFAHNTGEGGVSAHHLAGGGDLVWQIGTGYFGCRDRRGHFDPIRFKDQAAHPNIRMVELKISQGAKPGHGGILPARKLTKEIAEIRGVPLGEDVLSPPAHSAFSTPVELLDFLAKLRELSGKPVGMKLCIGKRREFLAVGKAMVETGLHPDYIAVDGAEGGTGAAPLEFANTLGCPLTEALIFVHNTLVGIGFREQVRVIASGKIVTGFDMARVLAIGADLCYAARAMMFALGCIQARRCNSNDCPVGVATQDPDLVHGLVVEDKAPRVARFQKETVKSFLELLTAGGLDSPSALRPWHILRRVGPTEIRNYAELYEYLERGALLKDPVPRSFARAWRGAAAGTFAHAETTVRGAEAKAMESV